MIVQVEKERAIELIEKVAMFFAKRRMGAPAILFIESIRPINFLASQVMIFLAPFVNVIFSGTEYDEFAIVIENRENVELLIKRIDELDEEINREEREREHIKYKKFWNKIKNIFKKKNNS